MRKETLGSIWNDSPHMIGGSVFDDGYAMVTHHSTVTHLAINPVQMGLTSGNRWEPLSVASCSTTSLTLLCNRPSGIFAFSQWNFASFVPGEILNFTRPVCGFPGTTFTYPAYIICVSLKKAKQRPDRNGQPGRKFADPLTFFQETRWEYRCHWVCYITEGCNLGG